MSQNKSNKKYDENKMDVVNTIAAFASAQAAVDLSQNFVSSILSPLTGKIFKTLNIERLSDWSVAGLGVGSFLEALIQFTIIITIVLFLVKLYRKRQ